MEREFMKIKNSKVIICLAILFLVACAPPKQAYQTATAQTQESKPTSSFTPIPPTETLTQTYIETLTETPAVPPIKTPTKIIILSPTPDYLTLQLNLKDFLLQQSDFPLRSNYSSIYDSSIHIPNGEVDSALVEDTGRIDGWSIWYGKDYGATGWLVVISDEISLYNTPDGAQLAVKKHSWSGFFEEINPPKIGDSTRAFYTIPGTSSQSDYVIIFSYRNLVHVVDEYGYENEVAGFVRNFARILLARLKTSPLINP
jgi:hypothetical protein